jgi:hypothetical protein
VTHEQVTPRHTIPSFRRLDNSSRHCPLPQLPSVDFCFVLPVFLGHSRDFVEKQPQNMALTSLQRAVAESQQQTGTGSTSGKKGCFESCFASGLDLSEFATSNSTPPPSKISAASELLKVKAREREEQEKEQLEEERMQMLVQQRAVQLKQSFNQRQQDRLLGSNASQSAFTNALLSMHKTDQIRLSTSKQTGKKKIALPATAMAAASSNKKPNVNNNSNNHQKHKMARQSLPATNHTLRLPKTKAVKKSRGKSKF